MCGLVLFWGSFWCEMRSTAVAANLCGRRKVLFGAGERCVAWAGFFSQLFVEVGLGLAAALSCTTSITR